MSQEQEPAPRQKQIVALRKAAADKAKRTREAAEKGLRQVIKSGGPITFASVARAAGVTAHYLRTQPDLAERIVQLRSAQSPRAVKVPAQHTNQAESSVIAVLRARIRAEKERHQAEFAELRRHQQDLETSLAAAYAEIQRLRDTYESGSETPP